MRVKLIRDKAVTGRPVAELEELGIEVRYANGRAGKLALLHLKLHQEAAKLAMDPEALDPYADVVEVISELARENNLSWNAVAARVDEKKESEGGFRQGRVMITDVPAGKGE